ncbi:MAG: hypothetical protein PHV32_03885 [Eubacteriales bacterium]|nr:hypothetical protein [Eubacteriales bacterium]
MADVILYIMAGVSTSAFLTLWFIVSHRELSGKKREVAAAAEQVQLHRSLHSKERGGDNSQAAKRMLDTSYRIYSETARVYNKSLLNAVYRIPGFIMGFRLIPVDEP